MFIKTPLILKSLFTLYLLFSFHCIAKDKMINAAVAEGFANGLHSKYLRYIAYKLDMPISITTIPFARRLKEIELGRLDIIVGLHKTDKRTDEFEYIYPNYESLTYRFYSLTKNCHKFKSYEDLQGMLIAVNRHSKYFEQFDKDNQISKLETKSLEQNIKLVLHGRADLFIHYEESTFPMLVKLGVDNQICKTVIQQNNANKHFIAISKLSHLMNKKTELQKIIFSSIKSNDFVRIRQEHYNQLNQSHAKTIALTR